MGSLIELKGKNEIDIAEFYFCISALDLKNKIPGRLYVDHLLIKDGFCYGTDSKRIHRSNLSGEYKNGLYRVFKALKTHVCISHEFDVNVDNYPDTSTLFDYGDLEIINTYEFYDSMVKSSVCSIIRDIPKNRGLNYSYIDDLFGTFQYRRTEDHIILEDGVNTCIVMLLSLE